MIMRGELASCGARAASLCPRSDGFTLVEIVVSIVLLGILAAVGSTMIADSVTTANISNRNQASISQARYAVERLAREFREVRLVANAYDITTNASNGVTFTKSNNQAVCVRLAGSHLQLAYSANCNNDPELLTNQASAFALSYLDISGAATVDPTSVRFVEINLTTSDPATGVTTTQRTRVGLRNFPGV